QTGDELATLRRLVGEEHGGPHRRSPPAGVAAEQAVDGLANLSGAERLLGEQRQLPAVEGLAELAILVCQREPRTELGGQCGTRLVEANRLAARLRRRDREQRSDAERSEVQPLEDDGPGC